MDVAAADVERVHASSAANGLQRRPRLLTDATVSALAAHGGSSLYRLPGKLGSYRRFMRI